MATNKADGSFAATLRFNADDVNNAEGRLLSRAVEHTAASRRGAEVLRVLLMRGWTDLIHNTHPRERRMQLISLGVPNSVLDEIESKWPNPAGYLEGPSNGRNRAPMQATGGEAQTAPVEAEAGPQMGSADVGSLFPSDVKAAPGEAASGEARQGIATAVVDLKKSRLGDPDTWMS